MTNEEWNNIKNSHTSAIKAPAGHGKTEMLTEIVENTDGKSLLLTHTNAGVDAIKKRMAKKGISSKKYRIDTIASFCIKWCSAYYHTAGINHPTVFNDQSNATKPSYNQYYIGASTVFQNDWAGSIIKCSYSRIVVDEYQDCTVVQHNIFKVLSKYIAITVLGDPLQGIFEFSESLVDWNNIDFPIIPIKTYPWRWKKVNPTLGTFLECIREQLLPSLSNENCTLDLKNNPNVTIIQPTDFNVYHLLPSIKKYGSVVFITKWERQQIEFCTRLGGIFQNDEIQECKELFAFSSEFDNNNGYKLALSVIGFMSTCATHITTELNSYIKRLKSENCDFSRIKKHKNIGILLEKLCLSPTHQNLLKILKEFDSINEFKIYRKELYYEMLRSIIYAIEHKDTIYSAANHIRKDQCLQKRYTHFKFLSTRTLLAKGLEFDCVIIDMRDKLSAKDFYVAMTRAIKKIYIISESEQFYF